MARIVSFSQSRVKVTLAFTAVVLISVSAWAVRGRTWAANPRAGELLNTAAAGAGMPQGGGSAYGGTPATVPGTVEAELFDVGGEGAAYHDTSLGTHGQDYGQPPNWPPPSFRQPTDVDIYKAAADYSNSYLIVMQAGDWMSYTVDIAQSGIYTLEARTYYWGAPGGTFHVEVDGVDKTGQFQLPGGSGWQTVTKTGVQLTAGRHTLKVVCDSNGSDGSYIGDIDYLRFVAESAPPPPPTNVAAGKAATQVSTYDVAAASRAVDGNTDGNYWNNSVTHTAGGAQEWWQVDLGAVYSLQTIKVWNRTDCGGERLSNFYVFVSDAPFDSTDLTTTQNQAGVSSYFTAGQGGTPTTITLNRAGRYVRVQLSGPGVLSLAEVEVLGTSGQNSPPASTQPAQPPHSLSLNGTDARVQVPDSASLNITGPVTVEAWIKANSASSTHGIVERYELSSGQGGYALRLAGGKLRFCTFADGNNYDCVEGTSAVSTGVWHHVAGVFDGEQLRVYLDGALDNWKSPGLAPGGGGASLMIGQTGAAHNPFSGLIDEVRVTAGARYQANFTTQVAQGADGSDTKGLWNFNSQTAHDSSGNSNHGTLVGGASFSGDVPTKAQGSSIESEVTSSGVRSVRIGFDELPHGTTVSNQYAPAVFSSSPNKIPYAWNPRSDPRDFTTPQSLPNVLLRRNNSFPVVWDGFAPVTVDFTTPVNNLRFVVCSVDVLWGTTMFQLDIYQRGVHVATWNIPSGGAGFNVPVNVGKPLNPTGFNEVTRIVIKNITGFDGGGLTFDDFSFEYTEASKVDITNPNIGGSLNGSTQNAMVGLDIPLRAVVTPEPSTGTYSWSFTGPVAVSGGPTNSSSVTIRATDAGTITAKVTYVRNGEVISATVNIKGSLPSLSNFSGLQEDDYLIVKGMCAGPVGDDRVSLSLGCPKLEALGMKFSATAQIPPTAYLTDITQGGIKYVQAVSTVRKFRFSSALEQGGTVQCKTGRSSESDVNSGWRLDNDSETGAGDPYENSPEAVKRFSQGSMLTIVTNDNPVQGWKTRTLDAIKVDDQFQMYVVYFTGSDPRAPLFQRRIGSLSWNWGGAGGFQLHESADERPRQGDARTTVRLYVTRLTHQRPHNFSGGIPRIKLRPAIQSLSRSNLPCTESH